MKFHPLETTIQKPHRFTFPFCYEPHALCRLAADELRRYVESVPEWADELASGKMLGVLVVETADGRLGYLAAFSGLLMGHNDHEYFVPPVFDATPADGHFKQTERLITAINHEVEALTASPGYAEARRSADNAKAEAERSEAEYREAMRQAKARRDALRLRPEGVTPAEAALMTRESRHMKAGLRRLRQADAVRTDAATEALRRFDSRIAELKKRRKQMSDELQRWLFDQYNMLNARGESKPLTEIFKATPAGAPPAAAGDCCEPKLLQYAYLNNLRPVCMAEFWYGRSPRSEVRHHLHYYPACRGRCLPILTWMMQGLDVDPDPQPEGCTRPLEIVYEDDTLIVVNKPAGMLSVPGRSDRESVLSLLRERCPDMAGPVMVHRLDMDTSGLLVAAKTVDAYTDLQRQFHSRTVLKRYVALVDGVVTAAPAGSVSLPLYSDPLDRPYQKVDFGLGKPSHTEYRILKSTPGGTLLSLTPHTGRTHQLRVHCASSLGLGCPIKGDRLYGHPADRLYLHAAGLSFVHPATGRTLSFERAPEF